MYPFFSCLKDEAYSHKSLQTISCLVSVSKTWTVALLLKLALFSVPTTTYSQTTTSSCPVDFVQLEITATERVCEYSATLTNPFTGRPSQSPEGQRLITSAATACRAVGTFTDGGDRGTDGVFVTCRVMLTQDEIDAMQPVPTDPVDPQEPQGPSEEELAEQAEQAEQERQRQEELERQRAEEEARNAPFTFDVPDQVQMNPTVSSLASGMVNVCEGIRQLETRSPAQSDLLERCIDINRESSATSKLVAIGQVAAQQYSDIGQSLNFLNTIQVGNIGGRLAAISPSLRQNARDVARAEYVHPDKGLFADRRQVNQIGGAAGDSEYSGSFGAFILGTNGDGDKQATQLSRGFDYQSQSMTFGVDYLWDPTVIIGLAYGYGDTESQFNAGTGAMDIRTDTLTAYMAKALKSQWSIEALVGIGDVTTDNVRGMNFIAHNTTVEQVARSQIQSDQAILSLGVTKGVEKWVNVDFAARFNYIRTDSKRFSETIDGSAPGFGLALELDANRIDSMTGDLSVNFSKAFSTSWGVIIPQARINWVREFEDDNRFMTGRFLADTSTLDFSQSGIEIGGPGSRLFRVPLERLDKSYGGVLIGINALLPNQISLSTSLNKTLGISGFDHTYFSLTARKDF